MLSIDIVNFIKIEFVSNKTSIMKILSSKDITINKLLDYISYHVYLKKYIIIVLKINLLLEYFILTNDCNNFL